MKHFKNHLIATCLFCIPLPVSANAVVEAIDECRSVKDSIKRLACYDSLDTVELSKVDVPRFEGKRTVKTELFSIEQATEIRFESDGAIFVLAVHDEQGEVVQNLHIGGGGEGRYILEEPGNYFLRINGSTTWRVWLTPQ